MTWRVVQPWGKDKGREATSLSEHRTVVEAFAEIDRIAAMTLANGSGSDYLELLVVDDDGRIVNRPDAH